MYLLKFYVLLLKPKQYHFHTNKNAKLSAFVYIFHINRQASEIVYPAETGQVYRKPNLYE